MEVSHQTVAAICSKPGCGQAIHVSMGRVRGGVNDRGGFVIECAKCRGRSYIKVPNPDDASSVTGGGRVVATWDDDVQTLDEVLQAYNLSSGDELSENMLVVQPQRPDAPQYVLDTRPIYRCLACGDELDRLAYDELGNVLDEVNASLRTFINRYLKGGVSAPDTVEATLDVGCSCTKHRVAFHAPFSQKGESFKAPLEFVLAGPDDPTVLTDIDGVYSRDDCISIFQKLLLRWRSRHRVVMLVVPFIGLDYPGREEDRVDLWNMVLGYTDPERTLLVTRRGTYNGFVKAANSQGIDIAALAKFKLLAPLLEELGEKGAQFKQQSHAKFYAAVGSDRTEVLSGSFNIHSGKYVENLLFKTYETSAFIERYLVPLGVTYDPELLKEGREVLGLETEDRKVTSMKLRRD